jgi:hypothetical protein
MRPPSYVKSVSIKNTTAHAVKVTVTFGSDEQEAEGNAKIVETREIAANEEATFAEQEYDMGSWTAVAAVDSVHAEPSGGVGANEHPAAFKPEVTGIVDLLKIEIQPHATSGALQIAAL